MTHAQSTNTARDAAAAPGAASGDPHAPGHGHIPGPGEPSVPEIEVDENIPPRPEEEIADLARAEPDVEDHSHPRE